jgi:hypothetical protein
MGYANVVTVTACGRVCTQRKRVNVSHVLAGQRVGIWGVDEGIWIGGVAIVQRVSEIGSPTLCSTISATSTWRKKARQPPDNPFGSRLLPMS